MGGQAGGRPGSFDPSQLSPADKEKAVLSFIQFRISISSSLGPNPDDFHIAKNVVEGVTRNK